MKRKSIYSIKSSGRNSVDIIRNTKVIGSAFHIRRGWFILNDKHKYVGMAKEKDNIVTLFKRKKGKAAPPKPRPLCSICPLHKTDGKTRKQIRLNALPKRRS